MSAPKKDWIFTVVLIALIAALSAVVAIYLLPSRPPAGGDAPPATARQDEEAAVAAGEAATALPDAPAATDPVTTASAAGRAEVPDAAADLASVPAAAPAGSETVYSPDGAGAAPPETTDAAGGAPLRPIDAIRPRATPRQAVVAAGAEAGADAAFPNLGRVNLFDPIVTPTASPTPRPPATPRENSLDKVLANWVLEYPLKAKTQWVFSMKGRPDQTYTVEIGKPYPFKDVGDFEAQVEVYGRYGVQFRYNTQVKTFSLVE